MGVSIRVVHTCAVDCHLWVDYANELVPGGGAASVVAYLEDSRLEFLARGDHIPLGGDLCISSEEEAGRTIGEAENKRGVVYP
jgi:hypothetical protein